MILFVCELEMVVIFVFEVGLVCDYGSFWIIFLCFGGDGCRWERRSGSFDGIGEREDEWEWVSRVGGVDERREGMN